MHDGIRRLSVLLLVSCAALMITYFIRVKQRTYGLFDLLHGEIAPTTTAPAAAPSASGEFTPATTPAVPSDAVPLLARLSDEYASLANAVRASVVSIDTTKTVLEERNIIHPVTHLQYLYREPAEQPGLGSGVIVSEEGHLLTSFHVIDNVDEIVVTTSNREQFEAVVLGYDEITDIALLQIRADPDKRFAALRFADSEKVRQGELVFAVGNPFGLQGTFTHGIISSAEPRRLSDSSPPLLQTNTVINPGNSGGPLVDVQGDIVGINLALYKGQEGVRVYQGYGLAIPSNAAKQTMENIRRNKVPVRGYLGVSVSDLTPTEAIRLGISDGTLVNAVRPGSPADLAGLAPQDVIVQFADKRIARSQELIHLIENTAAGLEVALQIVREGVVKTLSVTIREGGASHAPEASPEQIASVHKRTGLSVEAISVIEKRRLGLDPADAAVVVSVVVPGSPGATAGIEPGFLIHQVRERMVHLPYDFYTEVDSVPAATTVSLRVTSGSLRNQSITLSLP